MEGGDYAKAADAAQASQKHYVLRLFVTGTTPTSLRAIANVKRICEAYIPNHYQLEVVDVYQQPELAKAAAIIAVPTLIKVTPYPLKRLVGDMSKTQKVLKGLGIAEKSPDV